MSSDTSKTDHTSDTVPLAAECLNKFNDDGSVKFFPGITTLCHLRSSNGSHHTLSEGIVELVRNALAKQPDERFVALPRESWHVTLLDMRVYSPTKTQDYDPVVTQASEIKTFHEGFLAMGAELQQCLPIQMKIDLDNDRYLTNGHTLKIPVTAYDDANSRKLSILRQTLVDRFGLSLKVGYYFHITTHYPLKSMDQDSFSTLKATWTDAVRGLAEKVGTFEVDRMELCKFDDMTEFTPVAHVTVEGGAAAVGGGSE